MLPRSTMSASFLTSIARNISTVASAAPPQKTHAHDQIIGVLFAKILILIISNLRASHLQVVTCRCDGRHANFIPNFSSDLPASAEADRSHHAAAKEIPCKSPNIPSKTSLPPLREESVTYVSGTMSYLCRRPLSLLVAREDGTGATAVRYQACL